MSIVSGLIVVYCCDAFLELMKTRETSNKALNAINQMSLVPFLMSFLAAKDQLPLSTVTSAGEHLLVDLCKCSLRSQGHHGISMEIAQCLYVLTDENYPIIEEVRSNAEYTACLLAIVRASETAPKANGKGKDTSDARSDALRVLCCGTTTY